MMEGHDRDDRKWKGEMNGKTIKETRGGRNKKRAKEGHFATFSVVNDCLDKSVQIELTRTNTMQHLIFFRTLSEIVPLLI